MISLRDVEKEINGVKILNSISSTFDKGSVSVIVGPSGSGKTTLLRCMNGLDVVSSGSILVDGDELSNNSNHIQRKVGFVFQSFNLFPHMNVRENLLYAPVLHGVMTTDAATHKAHELLANVKLSEKADSMPSDLSGGQKQRVAICRALMLNVSAILFDEPTSALDPESVKVIVKIIKQLRDELAVIIVSHHIEFVKKVADRVLFMDRGVFLSDETVEQFINNSSSYRAKLFLE